MRRLLFLLLILLLPLQASAADYTVRPGDTLGSIAQRHHMSVTVLARANGISNVNLIRVGQVLAIPIPARIFYYRVRWGDTLFGIAQRYNLTVGTILSLNRSLGTYLIAGRMLRLCGPCSSNNVVMVHPSPSPTYGGNTSGGLLYLVRPGDTLSGIALRYSTASNAIVAANRISNPDRLSIGMRLVIPNSWVPIYAPWQARSLVSTYARWYGLEPALPLAVAWQESGFNQSVVSRTGAIGVMQVEPYTARHIQVLTGRRFNLYNLDDNIHAGVFWLATLTSYYGGNERLAVAAYYQGTRALARYGFFQDTVQYVNNVMALKASFSG